MSDKKEKRNIKGVTKKKMGVILCVCLGILVAKKLDSRKNNETDKK